MRINGLVRKAVLVFIKRLGLSHALRSHGLKSFADLVSIFDGLTTPFLHIAKNRSFEDIGKT